MAEKEINPIASQIGKSLTRAELLGVPEFDDCSTTEIINLAREDVLGSKAVLSWIQERHDRKMEIYKTKVEEIVGGSEVTIVAKDDKKVGTYQTGVGVQKGFVDKGINFTGKRLENEAPGDIVTLINDERFVRLNTNNVITEWDVVRVKNPETNE